MDSENRLFSRSRSSDNLLLVPCERQLDPRVVLPLSLSPSAAAAARSRSHQRRTRPCRLSSQAACKASQESIQEYHAYPLAYRTPTAPPTQPLENSPCKSDRNNDGHRNTVD